MRACLDLLNEIEEKYREQYLFLKNFLNTTNEVDDGECKKQTHPYFLGIRDGYMCIYYLGMCLAKVELNQQGLSFTVNSYYRPEELQENKIPYHIFVRKDQNGNYEIIDYIKRKIEDHVSGKHDQHKRREKVCQQWIINKNNESASDWYFVDMEYVFDAKPYGRPDLIAVNRTKEDGRYQVALIELKIGNKAYGGFDNEKYNAHIKEYNELKKDIYNESKPELQKLKFGSGIVSHIVDFIRFLKDKTNYREQLRSEIVEMIQCHQKLGLIREDFKDIKSKEELSEKPNICILSYSYAGSDIKIDEKGSSLSSMKQSMYKHLYDSTFCLQKMLSEKQIEGILKLKEKWNEKSNGQCVSFIKNDEMNKMDCMQQVGDEEYAFSFVFVDASKKDAWKCSL